MVQTLDKLQRFVLKKKKHKFLDHGGSEEVSTVALRCKSVNAKAY